MPDLKKGLQCRLNNKRQSPESAVWEEGGMSA